MTENKQSLIAEYDAYFTKDPGKWAVTARNQFAFQTVKPYTPKSIIDIGCGNGHTLKFFGQQYPEAELFGVDISPVAAALAEGNSGASVAADFLEDYKPGRQFDLVLCMGTAEHFLDPLKGLAEIRNLVAGYFYLEVPNNLSYSPGAPGYRRLSVGSHQLEWHWPRETWDAVIKDAGFEVVKEKRGLKPAWEFVWLLR